MLCPSAIESVLQLKPNRFNCLGCAISGKGDETFAASKGSLTSQMSERKLHIPFLCSLKEDSSVHKITTYALLLLRASFVSSNPLTGVTAFNTKITLTAVTIW